jgi:NADH-quinone oxidoreductase subunit N
MLAFSSIAQAGYVLIGVAAGSTMGVAAVAFYLAVYVFTNLAAFGVAVLVGNVAGDWIRDFSGLNRRSATLALVLVAALLSLGGVPPFGGFIGKLFLFAAAMEQGLTWLAVVGALNVILSLYYYLGVLRVAYVEPPEDESEIAIPTATRWTLGIASLGILVTGVVGYPLFQVILQAVQLWGLGK